MASAFKEMINNEIEATLTDSQDPSVSSAEQVESPGDSISLGALLRSSLKMENSLRSRCRFLTEDDYRMMNIRECIVEGENHKSFGIHSDGEQQGKHVIVHVAGLDQKDYAGYYDI